MVLVDCIFSLIDALELNERECEVFLLFKVDAEDFSVLLEAFAEIAFSGLNGEWGTA